MPIRHFDFFAQERKLLQTSPLTVLKECRVGIEGNYWLRKILATVAKEGAPVAMGGAPLSLRAAIDKEIIAIKSFNIIPLFVFNGLSIIRKDRPFSTEDLRPAKRTTAWDLYEKGKVEQALSTWASSGSIYIPDLLHIVFDALRDHNVEFMRAPYSSWAQLAYLERHPKQYIHAILGGSELLMYDVERLITGFDFKGTFTWLSKRAILADLGISDDQFLDVCIFAGFEYCSTFPPLTSDLMSFTFKSTHDIIKQYKTGYNAVQSYADHAGVVKANYIDAFCRTRCAVRHHIILTDDGRVEPFNADYAPSDIHEFIGYRLPDEVYYYLSQNLISPQVINNLISGNLIETPPLCNGETVEYRRLLNQLLDLRTLTLALLTKELHPFFQQRKVTSIYWFEPMNEHPMPHHAIAQGSSSTALAKWAMTQETIQEELKRQGSKAPIDGLFIMRATSVNPPLTCPPGSTENKQGDTKWVLDTKEEIVANVIGRMLELRGFLTPNHTHTPFGKALFEGSNAVESKEENNITKLSNFHSELFAALELARLGILHSGPYSRRYCSTVDKGADDEKRNILLITRAVSLVSVKFKGVPWTGPLSRELLLVNDLAKGLTRSLRNLCEMIMLSLFLSGGVRKDRNDYFEISRCLPFLCDYSTALGVMANDYLKRLIRSESTSDGATVSAPNKKTCDEAATAVESKFAPWCADVKGDLKRALKFWDQLVLSVKALEAEKAVTEELAEEFKSADRWLSERRSF